MAAPSPSAILLETRRLGPHGRIKSWPAKQVERVRRSPRNRERGRTTRSGYEECRETAVFPCLLELHEEHFLFLGGGGLVYHLQLCNLYVFFSLGLDFSSCLGVIQRTALHSNMFVSVLQED